MFCPAKNAPPMVSWAAAHGINKYRRATPLIAFFMDSMGRLKGNSMTLAPGWLPDRLILGPAR
jgi:hypothetical protein